MSSVFEEVIANTKKKSWVQYLQGDMKMKQNYMMDRLGIIHYLVVRNDVVVNSELIFDWKLISNELLRELKLNNKKWINP